MGIHVYIKHTFFTLYMHIKTKLTVRRVGLYLCKHASDIFVSVIKSNLWQGAILPFQKAEPNMTEHTMTALDKQVSHLWLLTSSGMTNLAPQKGKNNTFFSDRHAMKTSTLTYTQKRFHVKNAFTFTMSKTNTSADRAELGDLQCENSHSHSCNLPSLKKKNLHHYIYISQLHPLFPCFPSCVLTFTPWKWLSHLRLTATNRPVPEAWFFSQQSFFTNLKLITIFIKKEGHD